MICSTVGGWVGTAPFCGVLRFFYGSPRDDQVDWIRDDGTREVFPG